MGTIRSQQVIFLCSMWAVVSLLSLAVVGMAWSAWLKPQALADARARRAEMVGVLARVIDAQARDKLEGLAAVAAELGRGWSPSDQRGLQRELDALRTVLQLATLFVVLADGRPLAFSPLATPDGGSNLALRYGDRKYLQEAIRTQRLAVSGIVHGRAARELVVGGALPVRAGNQTVAYLVGAILLQSSIQAIEEAAARPSGWLALIDDDTQAVYMNRQTRQLVVEDWKDHPIVHELDSPEADGIVTLDGEDWLITESTMPTLRVRLVLVGAVRAILEAQRSQLLTLAATLLVSVTLSLVASTVVAVRFLEGERDAQRNVASGRT